MTVYAHAHGTAEATAITAAKLQRARAAGERLGVHSILRLDPTSQHGRREDERTADGVNLHRPTPLPGPLSVALFGHRPTSVKDQSPGLWNTRREAEPLSPAPKPGLEREEEEQEQLHETESSMQRKAADQAGGREAPPIVHEELRAPGQPLDAPTRAFMEARLGHNFGQVRVHMGARAAESAGAIHALAFTVGHHIVLGQQQTLSNAHEARQVLAHELVHVVQQSRSPWRARQLRLGDPADAQEQEAGAVAGSILGPRKGAAGVRAAAEPGVIQRFSQTEHVRIGETAYRKAFTVLQGTQGGPSVPTIDQAFVNNLRSFRFRTARKGALSYGQMVAVADNIASFELLEEQDGTARRFPLLGPIWDWIGDSAHYLDLASRNRAHFHPHNYLSWQPWHWQALRLMHRAAEFGAEAIGLKREVRHLLQSFDQRQQAARHAIDELDALTGAGASGARAEELERTIDRELGEMSRLVAQAEQKQAEYKSVRTQASNLALRAMAMNGFGDHFLTDAFAAGHIVTPRRELLDEYSTRLLGIIPVGGVLHCANVPSLAWHDLDNRFGVKVDNANGQEWRTYGDDYADEEALPGGRSLSPTMEHVVDATATSISQMWQAAGGQMPTSLLPVLNQLPRPKLDEYPAWSPSQWDLQLRFAAGEQVGANFDALSATASSNRSPVEVPNPKGSSIGSGLLSTRATCLDLLPEFNYQKFVVPMLARVRQDYEERYFTGRASQILPPDQKPVAQESVTGHVVLGSLLGTVVGAGLGLLVGGLIGGGLALALGGVLGGALGFLGGGLIGALFGNRRDQPQAAGRGGRV